MAQRQLTSTYDKSQPLGFRTDSTRDSDSDSPGSDTRGGTVTRDDDGLGEPPSPDADASQLGKKERKRLEKEHKKEEKRAKELEKEQKKLREKEEKLERAAMKKAEKADAKDKEKDKDKGEKPEKAGSGVVSTISQRIKAVAGGKKKGDEVSKLLHIHRGENEYRIKVYVGTPMEEILQTVLREADIEPTRRVRFLDGDGVPIVLSSHLPAGTRLYMQLLDGLPQAEPAALGFSWDLTSRSCRKHTVTSDGKTIGQSGNFGFGGIRSTQMFTHGTHFWSILFNPLQCCVAGGVAAPDEIVGMGGGNENPFIPTFAFSSALLGTPDSDGGNTEPTECGFLLNMDDHTLRVYNLTKGEHTCRLYLEGLPTVVYAAVVFKHVSSCTITNSSSPPPGHLVVSHADTHRHPRYLPCAFKGHMEDD